MAPYRTLAVPDSLYRSMVWLDYRLAVLFTVGLPLVLLVWAAVRRERALVRLLGIYWKVASLLLVTVLLLTDRQPLGLAVAVVAQVLVLVCLWFWVDLNEELADLPSWRGLPLTVRIWRWAISFWAVLGALFSATALGCMDAARLESPRCAVWLQPPLELHRHVASLFAFIFGGQWTPAVAAFVGYLGLVAYAVGLLQWLLVRLPRQGRVAGEF
ncbi:MULTISPECIES: DUF3177 family protein [Aphanothece]|uniref:DUF3177 family protein n=1 Tax=Aphanothece TaxID=1121 RepID=UPI0039848848